MLRFLAVLFSVSVFTVISFTSQASALTPRQAAERLFQSEEIAPEWFAQEQFAPAVTRVVNDLKEGLGVLRDIERCAVKCLARFEKGEVKFDIAIDTQGRITLILFEMPIAYASSLEEAVSRLEALSGWVSILVTQNGDELENVNADQPMAVGSAFKLAVLKSLDNLIGAGKLEWDQVVRFEETWRSLPSGKLQDWPVGAPITIHTLASLMISQSDNTATDALIDIVTRNSVEMISPRNRPFLKTRELFLLKSTPMNALRTRYLAGAYDERASILDGLTDTPPPSLSDLIGDPLLEMEWHFSTRELCTLITDLADRDVLQINPGVAIAENWAQTSYKGGSDFGVLNMTTGLLGEDGTFYCVSASWNDSEVLDEETFMVHYASILHQLE